MPNAAAPEGGTGPAGGYTPAELTSGAYGINSAGLDGTGQNVAILSSRTTARRTSASTTSTTASARRPRPRSTWTAATTTRGDADVEVELDIEVVNAISPKANVDVYDAPNSDRARSTCGTSSYPTTCRSVVQLGPVRARPHLVERSPRSTTRPRRAAAQGMTFLSAAGDSGAYDCESDGGTQHHQARGRLPRLRPERHQRRRHRPHRCSGGSYGSESVWNEGDGWAGGGGVSATSPARPGRPAPA